MKNTRRFGGVIKVKPEKYPYYAQLHANPWPEINAMITSCNISNYSIYFKDGYLFSYFEYQGENYQEDMQKMAADPATQAWWEECIPCLTPLDSRAEGELWASMDEVYHLD